MPSMAYTLFTAGESSVSGLVELPEDARKKGAKPSWLGYVGVSDVDATTERIKHLGGTVYAPPADIRNISRFSVVADPQMAMAETRPSASRRAEQVGPRRLARAARRRLGASVGFLRQNFWLPKRGRRHRHDGRNRLFCLRALAHYPGRLDKIVSICSRETISAGL
jgi:hypothetical protein